MPRRSCPRQTRSRCALGAAPTPIAAAAPTPALVPAVAAALRACASAALAARLSIVLPAPALPPASPARFLCPPMK